MELVELLGSDPAAVQHVDPRAWEHLLVYVPQSLVYKQSTIIKHQLESEWVAVQQLKRAYATK